jgi:hypothetical protein
MANQRNMAALDEGSPGYLGIIGGKGRRDDQRNGESDGCEPTELAHNPAINYRLCPQARAMKRPPMAAQ